MINLKEFVETEPQVIHEPDERLRVHSQPLSFLKTDIHLLKDYMYSLMKKERGIGLAAPQIGLHVRVIIIDVLQEDNPRITRFMINPEIVESSGSCAIEESCLSVPNKSVSIERKFSVTISYLNEDSELQKEEFSGLAAICIQHEIDHLNGVLISDYIIS